MSNVKEKWHFKCKQVVAKWWWILSVVPYCYLAVLKRCLNLTTVNWAQLSNDDMLTLTYCQDHNLAGKPTDEH